MRAPATRWLRALAIPPKINCAGHPERRAVDDERAVRQRRQIRLTFELHRHAVIGMRRRRGTPLPACRSCPPRRTVLCDASVAVVVRAVILDVRHVFPGLRAHMQAPSPLVLAPDRSPVPHRDARLPVHRVIGRLRCRHRRCGGGIQRQGDPQGIVVVRTAATRSRSGCCA